MCDRASRIGGSTCVLSDVAVVHTGYHQHAGSLAQHGRGDAGPRVQFLALETPGDGDGHIPMGHNTGQLSKSPRVYDISSEGERNNAWWL